MSPTKHHKAMAQQFKDYQAAKTVVKTLGDYEVIRLAEYKGHEMNMGKHKYFYDVEFRLVLKGHDHGGVKGTKKELLQDLENIAADAPKLRLSKLEMKKYIDRRFRNFDAYIEMLQDAKERYGKEADDKWDAIAMANGFTVVVNVDAAGKYKTYEKPKCPSQW